MMESDLISRSALIKDIRFTQGLIADESDWLHGYVTGLSGAIDAVTDAPAVDAVEVVRCKNCLHTREKNEYERNYLVDEVLICTSPDATDDCWNPVWPNHWCSYGERRVDDGE